MKKIIIIMIMSLLTFSVMPIYGQEEGAEKEIVLSSVSGELVYIDIENSTLAIKKLLDEATATYENLEIRVTPETQISKEEAPLELYDLKLGDNLSIEYTEDKEGNLEATTILVK